MIHCTVCNQKGSAPLYCLLSKSKMPQYLEFCTNKSKREYIQKIYREYIHLSCTLFVSHLKIIEEKYYNKHQKQIIDFVVFGFEFLHEMKRKQFQCQICTQTKPQQITIKCYEHACEKYFHPECILKVKKRIFSYKSKILLFCTEHYAHRKSDSSFEQIEWENWNKTSLDLVSIYKVQDEPYKKHQEYIQIDNNTTIPLKGMGIEIESDYERLDPKIQPISVKPKAKPRSRPKPKPKKKPEDPAITQNTEVDPMFEFKPRPLYQIDYSCKKMENVLDRQIRTDNKYAFGEDLILIDDGAGAATKLELIQKKVKMTDSKEEDYYKQEQSQQFAKTELYAKTEQFTKKEQFTKVEQQQRPAQPITLKKETKSQISLDLLLNFVKENKGKVPQQNKTTQPDDNTNSNNVNNNNANDQNIQYSANEDNLQNEFDSKSKDFKQFEQQSKNNGDPQNEPTNHNNTGNIDFYNNGSGEKEFNKQKNEQYNQVQQQQQKQQQQQQQAQQQSVLIQQQQQQQQQSVLIQQQEQNKLHKQAKNHITKVQTISSKIITKQAKISNQTEQTEQTEQKQQNSYKSASQLLKFLLKGNPKQKDKSKTQEYDENKEIYDKYKKENENALLYPNEEEACWETISAWWNQFESTYFCNAGDFKQIIQNFNLDRNYEQFNPRNSDNLSVLVQKDEDYILIQFQPIETDLKLEQTESSLSIYNSTNLERTIDCSKYKQDNQVSLKLVDYQEIQDFEANELITLQKSLNKTNQNQLEMMQIYYENQLNKLQLENNLINFQNDETVVNIRLLTNEAQSAIDKINLANLHKQLNKGFTLKTWESHEIAQESKLQFNRAYAESSHNSKFQQKIDHNVKRELAEDTFCMVCFDYKKNFNTNNTLLYCQQCWATFHKYCYNFEESTIKCDSCKSKQSLLICCLCEQTYSNIPLKLIEGKLYHLPCALLQSQLEFKQDGFSIELNIMDADDNVCFICSSKKGLKIKCYSCEHSCHLLCAFFWGYDIKLTPLGLLCPKHDTRTQREWQEQVYFRWHGINLKQAAIFEGIDQFIKQKLDLSKSFKRLMELL